MSAGDRPQRTGHGDELAVPVRSVGRNGHLFEQPLARGEVAFADFSQRQLSRGPGQQPHAQPVFDPRDELGQGRRRQAEVGRGRGEAATLGDADKSVHFGRGGAIHELNSRIIGKLYTL